MVFGRHPVVSIGVPVFNGERGIARCLESLLRQDYRHLEIVVSDNASTDRTAEICRDFASRDSRIRYVREPHNRGGVWNFNRVFTLSTGDYFMWSAHDDERDPAFVAACVAALEAHPDAVVCQTHTTGFMESTGAPVYVARLDSFSRDRGTVARYREALRHLPATTLYGLFRASAMRQTKLINHVIASDLAFLQELLLHGRVERVERALFRYGMRESWNTIHQDARHFRSGRKPWYYVPFVMLALEHAARIARSPVSAPTKVRLWLVLAVHQLRHALVRSAFSLARRLCPPARRERLGLAMYHRWLHNPNIEVLDRRLFIERVVKPQIGWWA